ncbi:E3 ubiquitin-protein ligase MYCBP2 isoform X5 [Myxocyprinus asiaticus]|uniref:E3 ubiquitin-protein ligase MYCBP2 isoform X5 n=1 Tax=Myxocyprinus asiaticus TaxID=70543 RepID=UPI002222C35F|nr:E3 ubiquitin-protein ligase MYCBP2 isoform X5 [Myxocyprinus asiaticus]
MMCAAAAAGAGGSGILSSSASHSMGLGVRVIPGAGNDFASIGSGMGSCPVVGARSDCRSRYQLLLSGRALAERYRRIYTTAINDKEQGLNLGRGKKALSKKKLKRRQKVKSKVKTRTKTESLDGAFLVPDIKLHSNPSAFNVYCNVRHCVLDWQQKEAALALASRNSVQSGDSDSEEEEEYREPAIKLPKIIGIGLCGVFELIKETRFSHPSLCLRSLQALLDMLQGQQPESFQTEPPDVLESLFHLLLETTVRSTGMNDPNGQTLTALSCACLFSLVVAWGDTGKTLQAVSAILTNNGSHACQTIQVPTILNALQRSVQAVLVGKIQIQDWFGNGIKRAALMNKWVLKEVNIDEDEHCLLQTDGSFLYLLCKDGLYKVGSGYSGTVRGHVYNSTSRIRNRKEKRPWLGFAQGCLLYRDMNRDSLAAIKINPETLEQEGTITMPGLQADGQNIVFTDGDYINQIAACKDDGFVVRIYATSSDPALQQELQLKLARKCLHACGISLFDLEKDLHIISTGFDEEAALIGAGREFALMRTASGKIYYTGKYQSLGIKQGGPSAGKWVELPVTKSPKIVQFSVGHDGSHALLVAEDGSVFFTGSASKGEDGESTKSRRQPKPYKPKKMIKLETKTAVYTACNNGSSSIVTKDGELYMFGKDAIYSDSTCQVSDLKGHFVTQVAMGKAHTCVLTKSGEVWTFGVNNKGQCGRDTGAMSQAGKAFGVENMATAMDEDLEDELDEKEEKSMMCQPGMHKWKLDQCMVCTVCGDCTGYGASCVSSGRPDRVPGGICGCGSGESGCSSCGCCKACARELDGQEARQRGIFDAVKEMIPLDLLLAVPVPPPPGVNIEEHIQIRQEEKRQRINRRHRLEEGRDGSSERGDKDASKITTYPPGAMRFDCELRAMQVSCGFHHSVVLMENGDVYTFGYGQHGQLGHGDVNSRGSPTLVQALSGSSTQVTAGSNHTAVLLMDGQVFTFGSFSKGQLGRPILDMPYWNAKPSPMPNIGAKYGRKATWIGASGDQTFLRIDEALINSHVLATSEIFASKHIIGLVPTSVSEPPPFKCLLINKLDGSCRTFNDSEQEDLQGFGLCLDPVYDVIWRFLPSTREMCCYNAVIADARVPPASDIQALCSILSPELALPSGSHATTTRSHGALHILGCLDTLAAMQELKMGVANAEEETQAVMKVYSKEDYSVVNRFESHGGGWGYSAHSVEAIRFCADTDILLGGLGLFGGRGEYTAKIKLFELGPDGGDHETDGDLLAETDVLAYDCAAREKYAMMFDEPVLLQLGWWYVAWARVSGPSSDCGSHGQATITTDDGVVFQFKSSKKSNNGTDVNAGQIPQLLYRLPSNDGNASKGKQQSSEPVHILKRSFARTVSVECFESLLSILHWSWTTLVLGVEELRGLKGFQYTATLLDLERLRFVGTCCLRLSRVYICEIFPISANTKAVVEESSKLAECVGKTRSLLKKILSEGMDNCLNKLDNDPQGYLSQPLMLLEAVLQECHNTFTACFHSFYPTPALQWACLCDLLNCLDQDIQEANFRTSSSRLLAAVMSALCNTSVKLTSILPIAYDGEVLLRSLAKQVSTENDSALAHRFPLLVAHMEKLSHMEENLMGMTTFREVLEKMLVIVVLPVRKSLRKEVELFSPHLVSNTCGLLASIVSELTASALGSEVDGLNSLHSVKSTPNRFTKTSQGRSWNTGNGSPDAICFTVDKPGVVLVGFCVYGGGGIHEYELEVLADDVSHFVDSIPVLGNLLRNCHLQNYKAQTEHPGDSAHCHRWTSLELVKGTYSTDDSPSDIAEIRLDKAVPLKENVKYAVRLRNYGSRTANGDGGMTTVQCSDGVTFTFSTCSLSSNGTNQTRGQIPQILYYRSEYDGDLQSQLLSKANEEDKNCSRALSVVSVVVRAAKDLLHRAFAVDVEDIPELLSSSSLFSMLLPLILAYIGPVASSVPKAAVEVFGLVQELLPAVSALNQKYAPPAFNPNQSTDSTTGNQPEQGLSACTTSSHYAVIESDHPYKQAGVTQYKVSFPDCVRWMTVEFDPQCGTAQSEDVLRLLIPSRSLHFSGLASKPLPHETINSWTELKKFFGSSGWPTAVLVLPGNEALFSLETASDYVKDEKACFYGFKCVAVGYEFNPGLDEGIIQLEKELAYLGSVCAAALMKKDLALPIGNELEEDLEILEEASLQVCKSHSGLLGKGLALSHSPTILEALEGNLPIYLQTNEHSFLEDFITCVQKSSGGRLARWLQPDSYADPQKTSLILNKDDIRCGWPTTVVVQTKDQYGDVVHVPNMKVEVKAVPVSQKKSIQQENMKKLQRLPGSSSNSPSSSDLTFGGHPAPKLEATYEPMIIKEARYIAITMMKAYENYSFEELRFASPTPKRPSENMLIRANTDGTYSANWTPGAVGLYTIHVTIDGIEIDAGLEVEVKDPPKGMIPPGTQMVKPKAEPQPSKVRKFVAKDSAGLRVRSHPSLQSEQIGIVQVNGTITFIDEIHNDDGVWLRLNDDTVKKYVPSMNGYTEAWCISFNQHLGRCLLVPVDEGRSNSDDNGKETSGRPSHETSVRDLGAGQTGGPGLYKVVKTGPSGHNIRSCPNLRGIPIGMLVLGNKVKAVGEVINSEGTWVQLDKNSVVEFCESDEGEAWSLARDKGGNQYLCHEEEQVILEHGAQTPPPSPFSVQAFNRGSSGAQGFDYGISNNKGDRLSAILNSIQSGPFLQTPSVFEQAAKPPSSLVHSPFVFGQSLSQQPQPQPQLPNASSRSLASRERVHKSSATGPGTALSSLVLRQKGDRENMASRSMSPASKHRQESRSSKSDSHSSRTVDQVKSKNNDSLSASEALILKSDTGKLRSDSHSRSHSPNHNTLQALKADGRTSGIRAESPNPGSRSSSPKQKTLTTGRSSPSSTSSPRSSSPHDKNLPSKVSPSSKAHLDPPRERSKSDSYTLDPDTLRKKKVPLMEPLRGRSTSPKPKLPPKEGKGGSSDAENRAPSPHVVQENLHSEVVEVCRSSALLSNDEANDENAELHNAEEGSSKVHFSIGKAPVKEELESRSSPKVSRKTSSRHVRPKKDKSGPLFKGDNLRPTEPAKQAMSPSVAECARAVFAAFLWHEGIVHDAMACSSFLKFNPELTKEHAPIRNSLSCQQGFDEKENKLKNRHSLEISSALNMFNISPHGPDISKMGSINKNKVLSMLKEPPLPEKCEDGKSEAVLYEMTSHSSMRSKSILPLTLQHLVAFWEDISMATIKAATQNMIFPSPGSSAILKKKENEKDSKKTKKEKKKKEKAEVHPRGNLFGEMAQLAMGGPEKDTICELCGESHPYPVTYHMRQAHPGCGRYAGGQGYNSIGHFCGGWAGNCGDGGIGGSTWYLVCDRCREKYLREKQTAAREKVKQSRKKPLQVKTPRALPTMEAHQVIRANALFLLSLSSAAEPSLLCHHPPKPFHTHLPSLKEGVSEEIPNKMGCLYLQTLARQHTENFGAYQDDNLFQDEMRYLRSTSVPAPYISVTPDACPNVFEEPGSNMKSMPPSLETSPITDSDTAKRTVFQRSYSVVASEYDKQHSASPARVKAVPRRRVHSGDAEVGSSLLRHPSPELSRLISAHGSLSKGERNFQWPVLAFVIQHHDLEGLEVAMKHALRKSACRVFAMEAFNWLLCNVTQTTSLHDILWHFVASLTPSPFEMEEEEDEENKGNKENLEQEKDLGVCEHPLSDILIAGEAAHPLPHTFHRLLQTISDLMMSLPSGSSLQQMALRCWSLKFKQSDHQFLHQSNVFHHINNILSKSDDGDSEESFNISVQSGYEPISQELCVVTCLKDLTSVVDIKTSSRPAMIGSLTDSSTETFWESGDEDKNKTKSITISCVKGVNASYVSVHVDNSRDIGNKVTSMTFLCGKAVEDLCRIKQIDLDSRHMGWITSELPGGDHHVIKIELKGPENTLRVRQVKVLGWKEGESIKIAGQISSSVTQQKNCETETLRVFRLITSQVFGKLICGDAEPTPEQEEKNLLSSPEGEDKAPSDADLKEHMVGIIFSRSKLTNLQKQVCAHIVQAIRMEATRVREEWEHAISSKENANSQPSDDDASSDAYCFELLSMVLALSGSNVGRQYLAQQLTLLQDLFSLLHTASPRVQRQVTSLLRRVLPEVTPMRLASVIGVKALPPADISDIIHSTEKGDWTKLGILDMFLGCIGKALTVQLKAKGTTIVGTAGMAAGKGVTTVTLPMIFNSSYIRRGESHWWMKGSMPPQIAEIIIKLVKDMAAGHLSDAWSRVTKNAIAETIIALTKMEEEHRSPVRCIATTRMWLALASLCVLDQDHVDRLSSGRWMGKDGQQKQMPMCDNHDDGETAAIILCNACGNLCTDCDRFLHLHRRTRTHQRQVFKEEEEAIKVDLHEGCGRTKLFWLMALADSKTMKAMVEFREHTGKPASSSSDVCRFCGTRNGTELSAVGSVCSDQDCQEYAKLACSKTHPCGHPCGGVKNEELCLPCLHGCDKTTACLKQDADDMCMICFTEALSAAPAIQMDCSHVFHLQCTRRVLENRWLGPRITFGFMSCAICKNKINHSVLKDLLDPIKELYEDVRRKALMRLEYEGLHKSEAITMPGARFYNDPAAFAMNRYAYYVCYKCKKAYFGGEARCDAEAGQGDDYDPSELICGGCSDVSRAQMCSKHGTDFLEYKCRYCCSVAVFFCFGTTHFCNACHDDFQRMTSVPKEELPHCPAGPKGKQLEGSECPLHVVHPPTGEEFALGCGVCRNAHTF